MKIQRWYWVLLMPLILATPVVWADSDQSPRDVVKASTERLVAALKQHQVEIQTDRPLAESLAEGIRQLTRFVMLCIAEYLGIENIRAQSNLASNFLADGHLISGDHLHVNSHLLSRLDRVFTIYSRRIRESENT